MLIILALLHFPVLMPIAMFSIAYLAPTSYYLEKGFFIKDDVLKIAMQKAQTYEGECFEKSLAFADILNKLGIEGHVIKVGRFDDGDGDYHAWVEYKGAVWESVMPGIHYGMDAASVKKLGYYKVYGEIRPGGLDFIKFDSKKKRQEVYLNFAGSIIVQYEKEHK